MPMFEGPDCSLFVRLVGDGDPVTVFAHGLTGTMEETAPLAARVAGTRVLYDLRGHGRSDSPPPEAGYGHDAMRRDLEAVADAYGATRAFGISVGCGALQGLLADRPDRFERMAMFIPASIDAPNATAAAIFPLEARWLETMTLEDVAERILADNADGDLLRARPYWRELIHERVLRMNATGIPRALRAFVDGPPPVADGRVLSRVTAPVLVMGHEGDPLHDAAVARRLAGLLPGARLRVWAETLEMYDDLDAFAQLIADWFAAP